MISRATVLLRHECGPQSHFDWMIEDPAAEAGAGRLLTWRMAEPTSAWADLERLTIHAIDAHRRDFLTYEGELTGGRGSVRRIDHGAIHFLNWSEAGGELDVKFTQFTGRLLLHRVSGDRWELRPVSPGAAGHRSA